MSGLIRHLSISQSHVFLLNSRLSLFIETHRSGYRLFRSYAVNLPSSLATDHSSALGYSPRLPVSVYGTGCIYLKLRSFSRESVTSHYPFGLAASRYCRASAQLRIYLELSTPKHFNPNIRHRADFSPLRPSIAIYTGTRILTCFPSASPFGLSLGPD